jgi:hypothetical protein
MSNCFAAQCTEAEVEMLVGHYPPLDQPLLTTSRANSQKTRTYPTDKLQLDFDAIEGMTPSASSVPRSSLTAAARCLRVAHVGQPPGTGASVYIFF